MRGSIQKKGATYYIVLPVRTRRKWLKVGTNKKEAERVLAGEMVSAPQQPVSSVEEDHLLRVLREVGERLCQGRRQSFNL
jgi:hypothetical protein